SRGRDDAQRAQFAGQLSKNLIGPTSDVRSRAEPVQTDASQFRRTVEDVTEFMEKQGRIPSTVWLGSTPIPPEMFLQGLAEAAKLFSSGKKLPETITLKPAKLATARYVADDDSRLWGWIIFPPGFRAP